MTEKNISSRIQNVDGALSGALVFGVQASYLTLKNLTVIGGANAVRFSENVAFDKTIRVEINSSDIQNTTTSEIWPNGGFLYLPQDIVNFTMNFTNISFSSAPNGDGGFLFIERRSTIEMERCRVEDTSAGKCGGFIRADEYIDSITFERVTVNRSTAGEDGGALHLTRVQEFIAHRGGYTECNAGNRGGAMFFEDPDRSGYRFSSLYFWANYAKSNMGNDLLFSFAISDYYYHVTKKNFYNCHSNTTGYSPATHQRIIWCRMSSKQIGWLPIRMSHSSHPLSCFSLLSAPERQVAFSFPRLFHSL